MDKEKIETFAKRILEECEKEGFTFEEVKELVSLLRETYQTSRWDFVDIDKSKFTLSLNSFK